MTELTKTDFRLAAIVLLSASILTFTSCFPTEHYEPDFNVVSESASQIPSSGLLYDAEFNWKYVETRTSKPIAYRQFRFRLNLDSKTGKTQIPNERVFPTDGHTFANGDWAFRENAYGSPAVLYVQIPENTSADSRMVSIEICIDSLYNYSYTEVEGQEHRWGEWFTVFEGTQAGKVYPDEMMPSHSLEKSQANIFEPVRINMHKCDEVNNLWWYKSKGICDSLVWSIRGFEDTKVIMEHGRETIYFDHLFTHPGELESVLSAYKDGKVISEDVKNITITNKKDFLMFDWEDIISGTAEGGSYHNAFDDNRWFSSGVSCEDGNPVVIFNWNNRENYSEKENHRILREYISHIYGEPVYTEKSEVESQWTGLFMRRDDRYRPECIWMTETSVVALFYVYNELTETGDWKIIAEPLRK